MTDAWASWPPRAAWTSNETRVTPSPSSGASALSAARISASIAPLLGDGVTLVSFDVHAARGGHEAQASVTLGVQRRDQPDAPVHAGGAVDENVVQASVVAYIDAVNTLLVAEGVDIAAAVPTPGDTSLHETDPEHQSASKDRIMSAYNQ